MDHAFEGISIGLKENVADIWNLAFAIVAHEVVIAFRYVSTGSALFMQSLILGEATLVKAIQI